MSDYNELSRSNKRILEAPFQMESGYVLDFSNRTIEEFFEDEFNLEFYSSEFSFNGESKAKTLRAVLSKTGSSKAVLILRRLWEYRSTLPNEYRQQTPEEEQKITDDFFDILAKLEDGNPKISTDALEVFESSETLSELINSIERDIRADAVPAALDRLHTYCQKKFRFLIEARGEAVKNNEPLNSRVGRYAKILESEAKYSAMTIQIVKNSISIFERYNSVRNDQSLAHDNVLIEAREARFIFDSVSSLLRFVKSIDTLQFGS